MFLWEKIFFWPVRRGCVWYSAQLSYSFRTSHSVTVLYCTYWQWRTIPERAGSNDLAGRSTALALPCWSYCFASAVVWILTVKQWAIILLFSRVYHLWRFIRSVRSYDLLYIHSCQRSGIPSCWTVVVEQPSVQPTTVRPYPSSVPPGVKDIFIWLTGTPAPSDLFLVCYTKCSYLLTYLYEDRRQGLRVTWPGLRIFWPQND